MAVNVENQSTGISMTQAMRDKFEDAAALGVGVAEAMVRNPKKVLGTFAVAASLAISGNGEKVVTVPVDLAGKAAKGVESVGASMGNFVFTEPTVDHPSLQEVQDNVAQNVINNMSQDATQAEQAQELQEHGLSPEVKQIYSDEIPYSEDTVAPTRVQADPSLTGGAAPGEISGGSPAQP